MDQKRKPRDVVSAFLQSHGNSALGQSQVKLSFTDRYIMELLGQVLNRLDEIEAGTKPEEVFAHYEIASQLARESHPGMLAGDRISFDYLIDYKRGRSGSFLHTGVTVVSECGQFPGDDAFWYDADGKQFEISKAKYMITDFQPIKHPVSKATMDEMRDLFHDHGYCLPFMVESIDRTHGECIVLSPKAGMVYDASMVKDDAAALKQQTFRAVYHEYKEGGEWRPCDIVVTQSLLDSLHASRHERNCDTFAHAFAFESNDIGKPEDGNSRLSLTQKGIEYARWDAYNGWTTSIPVANGDIDERN